MAKSRTTLTLDDMEMIGEVVMASEERILKKVISKDDFVALMEGAMTTIIEKKFREVIGQFPKRSEFFCSDVASSRDTEKSRGRAYCPQLSISAA